MKTIKVSLIALMAVFVGAFYAQAQDINKAPHMEVTGIAEKYVAPDEIILSIIINEKDYTKKENLANLEKNMIQTLKDLGIDTKKNLTVSDIASDFKRYKVRKNDVKLSKSYRLKTFSAKQATSVILALEEIGISEIEISEVKCTKIEEYRDEVRILAIKDAKRKATLLTEAIGQPLGKAIYIYVNDFSVVRNYKKTLNFRSTIELSDSVNVEELPEINFEDIKIEYRVQVRFLLD